MPEGDTEVSRRRAYAYITREVNGHLQLAVFTHQVPDVRGAGVQVPGGTIVPEETPQEGALREAFEESGLEAFASVRPLATDLWHWDGKRIERHFYHLHMTAPTEDVWDHVVSDGCEDKNMVFRYTWVSLDTGRRLIAHMGDYLHLLVPNERCCY